MRQVWLRYHGSVGNWQVRGQIPLLSLYQEKEELLTKIYSRKRPYRLVSAYIDGDIPKESYLKIKEELMKEKLYLNQQKQDFGQKGKNWIELLRSFILDTKKANFLASSDDYLEIKEFVRKVGTNPQLFNKSVSFSFCPPFDFVAKINSKIPAEPRAERGARRGCRRRRPQQIAYGGPRGTRRVARRQAKPRRRILATWAP